MDRHGTELLPLLRAERPEAAMCLLSGTSEADPPDEEGVDGFIRKPFELEVLTETVPPPRLSVGPALGSISPAIFGDMCRFSRR